MRIGITDTLNEDKYDQYVRWMHGIDPHLVVLRLSHRLGNENQVTMVDGILLSGGGDIHPRFYNRGDALALVRGVDEKRDAFEFSIIRSALDEEKPILGICRGMQVMNVFLGGTMKVDLPLSEYQNHSSSSDSQPTMHKLAVAQNSMLHALTQAEQIEVNSFHHQAVDQLGKGLMSVASSADGVTEAIEWAIKDTMPFLLLVQWHPERMVENFLSQKIARMFLREVNHNN